LVAFDVEMRSTRTPEALEALKKEIGEWDLCPAKKMPKSGIP